MYKKVLFLIIVSVYTVTADSKEMILYGFYPAWHIEINEHEQKRFRDLNNALKLFLLEGEVQRNELVSEVKEEDVFRLVKMREEISHSNSDSEGIIGFYHYNQEGQVVFDFFRLDQSFLYMDIKSHKSITLPDFLAIKEIEKAIIADFNNPISFRNQPKEVNVKLDYYLEPYGLELKILEDVEPPKPSSNIKHNGKISPQLDEILKGIEEAIRIPKTQFGLKNILQALRKRPLGRKQARIKRKYAKFFAKHPIFLKYLDTVVSYNTLTSANGNYDKLREVFENKLDQFLKAIDNSEMSWEERKFWEKYNLDISETKSDLLFSIDDQIKCSYYKGRTIVNENNKEFEKAINSLKKVISLCQEKGELEHLRQLYQQKEKAYREGIAEAEDLAEVGNKAAAIDIYLRISQYFPYFKEADRKIQEYAEADERNKLLIKTAHFEAKVASILQRNFQKKMIENRAKVELNGKKILISIERKVDNIGILSKMSYYPIGSYSYKNEHLEIATLSDIINEASAMFQPKGDTLKLDMLVEGIADRTSYHGRVKTGENYSSLQVKVKDCNSGKSKDFQSLIRSESSSDDKNLALAFLRAYHKSQRLLQRSSEFISSGNIDICARIKDKTARNRGTKINLQINLD